MHQNCHHLIPFILLKKTKVAFPLAIVLLHTLNYTQAVKVTVWLSFTDEDLPKSGAFYLKCSFVLTPESINSISSLIVSSV